MCCGQQTNAIKAAGTAPQVASKLHFVGSTSGPTSGLVRGPLTGSAYPLSRVPLARAVDAAQHDSVLPSRNYEQVR